MKYLILFTLLLPSYLLSTDYICKEHHSTLTLKKSGYEHVNHQLFLNKNIFINELAEEMWFIKDIKCIKSGFELVVNHAQYNNFKEKIFILKVSGSKEYTLKEYPSKP